MTNLLTKILICNVPGVRIEKFARMAKDLRYPMFAFNGFVYSTNEYLLTEDIKCDLFKLSEVV